MTVHKELLHLGETLKSRRQERHLSLKEIENATSIRMNFLSAIEEGQISELISPIYAQGFIKKYATFLEIDGENLLREHPFLMKILNEPLQDKPEFTLGLGSVEVRGTPAGEIKWLPNAIWVGASVLFILAAYFVSRYFGII